MMDSKNIYIACSHYELKMKWDKEGESEWYYVGLAETYNVEKVSNRLANFFDEPEVYFVNGRHNSFVINLDNATLKIAADLVHGNVILCNKMFTKMMEFNRVGVARQGRINGGL